MTTMSVMPAIALPDPDFMTWERSFHAHPCEVTQNEVFVCGHESSIKARATCPGCQATRFPVYLCTHHMQAYRHDQIVYHIEPCGVSPLLSEIEHLGW